MVIKHSQTGVTDNPDMLSMQLVRGTVGETARGSTAKKRRNPARKARAAVTGTPSKLVKQTMDVAPTQPGATPDGLPHARQVAPPALSSPEGDGAKANVPTLALRMYAPNDDALVMKITQEEIAPIYKASYGQELDMNQVMSYIAQSYTRMVVLQETVIGFVSVEANETGRLNVGTIAFLPAYQGQGFGARVLRQLEAEARAMGLIEMEAYVQPTNQRSLAFFARQGYGQVPTTQQGEGRTVILRKSLLGQTGGGAGEGGVPGQGGGLSPSNLPRQSGIMGDGTVVTRV